MTWVEGCLNVRYQVLQGSTSKTKLVNQILLFIATLLVRTNWLSPVVEVVAASFEVTQWLVESFI